ncbi:MAG: hypothetical protein OEW58_00335 [Gammaproteobacteria bacterium]|nr:hypothetical protein [Gammaproteobacteria bacterium]
MILYFSERLIFFPTPPEFSAFADWLFYGFCIAGIGFAVFYAFTVYYDQQSGDDDIPSLDQFVDGKKPRPPWRKTLAASYRKHYRRFSSRYIKRRIGRIKPHIGM